MGMLHTSVHMDGGNTTVRKLSTGTYLVNLQTEDGNVVSIHATTMGPLTQLSQTIFDFSMSECANEGWPL